jgi:hypothetical protein
MAAIDDSAQVNLFPDLITEKGDQIRLPDGTLEDIGSKKKTRKTARKKADSGKVSKAGRRRRKVVIDETYEEAGVKPVVRHRYGENKHVLLSDADLVALQTDFPDTWKDWIKKVDDYVERTNRKYKNFLLTIRTWARRDRERHINTYTSFVNNPSASKQPVSNAGYGSFQPSVQNYGNVCPVERTKRPGYDPVNEDNEKKFWDDFDKNESYSTAYSCYLHGGYTDRELTVMAQHASQAVDKAFADGIPFDMEVYSGISALAKGNLKEFYRLRTVARLRGNLYILLAPDEKESDIGEDGRNPAKVRIMEKLLETYPDFALKEGAS